MRKILLGLAVFMLFGISSSMVFSFLSEKTDAVHLFSATDTRITIEEGNVPEKLMPGTEISREPRVRNLSESPCFVRAAFFYCDDKSEEITERLTVRDGWEQRADGYYYWKSELLPGEVTEALFDGIVIQSELQEDEMKGQELLFYAEAVGVSGSRELAWERLK